MLQRLPAPLLRDEPWANGAGTTTVLALGPDKLAWRWRISIARDDRAAQFSVYPDTLRQLTPLDGRLQLHFGAMHTPASMTIQRLQVVRFDGACAPRSELPDGPTQVFNLMTRAAAEAELLARPLVGGMLLPDARRWLLYLARGRATVQQGGQVLDLSSDETATLSGGARLQGEGEVLLVRFDHD